MEEEMVCGAEADNKDVTLLNVEKEKVIMSNAARKSIQ